MNWMGYPSYKDSSNEWLKRIPSHWIEYKLKYIASVDFSSVDKHSVEGEQPVQLCNYTDVYNNDYITPDLDLMKATASSDEIDKFKLNKGDVLVTKDSEDWNDIAVPAYVTSEMDNVLCGYHLAKIKADTSIIYGRYLFRAFTASGLNDQFRVAATGITRYGLGKYWLDNSLFPAPPREEQDIITSFLDHETAHIDTLISKKQRQIELLQEKRAALISHVVIKGLDPNAKMKDSGIEWLGEIPEHWNILRIANFADKITNGYVGPTRDILLNEGIPYLQSLHIKNNKIHFDQRYYVGDEWSREHEKSILKRSDVLVVQTGDIGQVATVPSEYEGANCHALIIISPKPSYATGEYLSWVLNSHFGYNSLKRIQTGALHPHLNCTYVREISIPIPPILEQNRIVDFITMETTHIDSLNEKINDSIDKLQEYRTALISAAVTGKIDVRKEVA